MEENQEKPYDIADNNRGIDMNDVIHESVLINEHIKNTKEYKNYINTKRALYDNMDLKNQLKEFRRKNYELQNRVGVNPYDEVSALVREYDDLLHNSIVSDFLRAEQKICKQMQKVYDSIADGLEFDYPDEQY